MIDGLGAFFLICFGVGAAMILLSVLTGIGHAPLHAAHIHMPGHGHAGLHAHGGGHGGAARGVDGVSPFNGLSLLVFVTWFGGAGFLLHGPLGLFGVPSLAVALVAGALAALIVFQFLARVLAPQSVALDPTDFRLEGQVGTVTGAVRAGGVGEVQFSQHGRRRSIGARRANGQPLERGTEVVIVAVEHGLAQVEPWDQFVAARGADALPADAVGNGRNAPRRAAPVEEKS